MKGTIADTQPTPPQRAAAKKLVQMPADGPALCPVRDVLARLGDKWSLLVILNLGSADNLRFNELRRSLTGISQRMLTATLRALERDGLVARAVYAEVPPRVEYQLTALGTSFLAALLELGKWASDHAPAIAAARGAYQDFDAA